MKSVQSVVTYTSQLESSESLVWEPHIPQSTIIKAINEYLFILIVIKNLQASTNLAANNVIVNLCLQ